MIHGSSPSPWDAAWLRGPASQDPPQMREQEGGMRPQGRTGGGRRQDLSFKAQLVLSSASLAGRPTAPAGHNGAAMRRSLWSWTSGVRIPAPPPTPRQGTQPPCASASSSEKWA